MTRLPVERWLDATTETATACWVIIAIKMTEDMSFGNWQEVTPETMKSWSEAKLQLAMKSNQGGVYDTWARAELVRRRDEQLGSLINQLTTATGQVHKEVAILNSSSTRLERLTGRLNVPVCGFVGVVVFNRD
jgi:hypothetical protein